MNNVINAIVGILALLLVGNSIGSVYHAAKREALLKVYRGLHENKLEPFTRKLTGKRLPF